MVAPVGLPVAGQTKINRFSASSRDSAISVYWKQLKQRHGLARMGRMRAAAAQGRQHGLGRSSIARVKRERRQIDFRDLNSHSQPGLVHVFPAAYPSPFTGRCTGVSFCPTQTNLRLSARSYLASAQRAQSRLRLTWSFRLSRDSD